MLLEGRPLDYPDRGLRGLRRRVQMVLQDAAGSLNPRQTVYESVAEGIRLHRPGRPDPKGRSEADLVAAALAEAGLRPPERLFLRYPHELSGGQKQRVLHRGRAGAAPELILADEPVSSLDASIRGEILALLLKLRSDLGMGVVVVTHDLGLAWNIADRIAVMYLGRVVECGTTEEVLGQPAAPLHPGAAVGGARDRALEPVVLTGEIPDPSRIPSGCRFHPRCPQLADGTSERAGVADACRGYRSTSCRPLAATAWPATSTQSPPVAAPVVEKRRRLPALVALVSRRSQNERLDPGASMLLLTHESVRRRHVGVRASGPPVRWRVRDQSSVSTSTPSSTASCAATQRRSWARVTLR